MDRRKRDRKADRRGSGVRRDFNDLVRDDSGRISLTKVGGMLGQWMVIKMMLEHGVLLIENWESLALCFAVLVAPGMFFKFLNMKYGSAFGVKGEAKG